MVRKMMGHQVQPVALSDIDLQSNHPAVRLFKAVRDTVLGRGGDMGTDGTTRLVTTGRVEDTTIDWAAEESNG